MAKLEPAGDERVAFTGKLFQVILKPMRSGNKTFEFERVLRPPGTRLIIIQEGKILLTREYRTEFADYDYRLPGGKVFDTLEEFLKIRGDNHAVSVQAKKAAEKECREETGLLPTSITHLCTSQAGATIEWDLHYFVVEEFETSTQNLEPGEEIEVEWHTYAQAKKMCLDGSVREERSVGILLRFLESKIL